MLLIDSILKSFSNFELIVSRQNRIYQSGEALYIFDISTSVDMLIHTPHFDDILNNLH